MKTFFLLIFLSLGVYAADFTETIMGAEVNWTAGIITIHESAKITSGVSVAKRIAELKAYRKALQVAEKIRVNSDEKLAEYAEKHGLSGKLSGIIKSHQFTESDVFENQYKVTLKIPLYGIQKGTLMDLLGLFETKPKPYADKLGAYTGIIIDMRGTGIMPALLPQIRDSEGNVLFSKDTVDLNTAAEEGMAVYVKSIDEALLHNRAGDNPVVLTASVSNPFKYLKRKDDPPKTTDSKPQDLGASSSGSSKKSGSGLKVNKVRKRPVTIQGDSADGSLATTVIVGKEAAKTINQAEKDNKVLSNCRVIIVTDSEITGTMGKIIEL